MGLLEEYVGYLISLTRKLEGLGICLGECESADYEGVFTLGECLESCLWYVDVMFGGKCVFDLADSDVEEWCSAGEGVTDRKNVAESSVDPMSMWDEGDDEDIVIDGGAAYQKAGEEAETSAPTSESATAKDTTAAKSDDESTTDETSPAK